MKLHVHARSIKPLSRQGGKRPPHHGGQARRTAFITQFVEDLLHCGINQLWTWNTN